MRLTRFTNCLQLSLCGLCRQPLTHNRAICHSCLARLPAPSRPVCRCSLPCGEADAGQLCGRCLEQPPLFSRSHCTWLYRFPLNRLINHYKHHGQLALEPLLTDIWLPYLPLHDITDNSLLVPIPIHWRRHGLRGFNQAERFAAQLAKHTGVPLYKALNQPRVAPMLQGLSGRQRRSGIRGQFRVCKTVTDRHIILIDDVMTTGSTANEATRVLLNAGAIQVDLWTLCRVMPSPLNKS